MGSGDFPCRSDRYAHGMVEYGWFNAEKGHVYLCDERGVRTGTSKALRPGESAEEVARRLLKDEVGKNAGLTSVDRFAIRSWFISSGHLPTIPGADWSAGRDGERYAVSRPYFCGATGVAQLGCTARRLLEQLFFESYLRQLRRERPIFQRFVPAITNQHADGAKNSC